MWGKAKPPQEFPTGGYKMSGTSKVTEVVGLRLPVEVARRARVNAEKRGVTLSQYLAKIITIQVTRKR